MLNTRTSTYQNPINFFVNPLQNQKSPYEKCDNAYTFGFNGQEKENDISGVDGGHLVFEYRIHDSRLGRFLSVDPLEKEYPWNSTYAFSENRPIDGVDLEGKEFLHFTMKMIEGYAESKVKNKNSSEVIHYMNAVLSHPIIQGAIGAAAAPTNMVSHIHTSGNASDPAVKQYNEKAAKAEFASIIIGVGISRMAGGVIKSFYSSTKALTEAGRGIKNVLSKNESYVSSFKGGKYTMSEATEDITVYRVHGGKSGVEGDFFTPIKPTTSNEAEQMLNINKFGNTGDQVTSYTIKKGTQYATGEVSGGTGKQIVIPRNLQNAGGNKVTKIEGSTERLPAK